MQCAISFDGVVVTVVGCCIVVLAVYVNVVCAPFDRCLLLCCGCAAVVGLLGFDLHMLLLEPFDLVSNPCLLFVGDAAGVVLQVFLAPFDLIGVARIPVSSLGVAVACWSGVGLRVHVCANLRPRAGSAKGP